MDRENITNSEMEAQFRERNTNLKNDINQAVNTVSTFFFFVEIAG